MKISKKQLTQIIREEIQNLNDGHGDERPVDAPTGIVGTDYKQSIANFRKQQHEEDPMLKFRVDHGGASIADVDELMLWLNEMGAGEGTTGYGDELNKLGGSGWDQLLQTVIFPIKDPDAAAIALKKAKEIIGK